MDRCQQFGLADGADAPTPSPRAAAVLLELVAADAQRVVGLDVLDRVVARVGVEHVHGVDSVLAQAPAVGPLADVDVDPVLALDHSRVGDGRHVAHAGGDPVGADRRQGGHQRVADDVARGGAGDRGAGEGGVGERATLGDDPDRAHQARVLGHVLVRGLVEQDRAQGYVDGDVDGADKGHVDGPVGNLGRRAAQVDRETVAGDGHADFDELVAPLGVVRETVDPAFGAVGAVGQPLNLPAQHALRVIHQVFGRGFHRVATVLVQQVQVPVSPHVAGGDLRFHVPDHHVGGPYVVAQEAPDHVVATAAFVALDGLQLEPFRVGVHRFDDAARARRHRLDVEMVRRREAEADQVAVEEDRRAEADVRPVRGAVVRRVVDDHVARIEALAPLPEELEDAAQVARDRAQLQWRGERALADLAAIRVEQRDAEILRLADDRGIGHPHQLVARFEHDRVERAGDHARGHRVDRAARRPAALVFDDVDFGRLYGEHL